jgi:hypothetical protein
MSLYVGSSDANHGEKTSGVIDHNSAYTWMAWVDLASDTNDYGHIWAAIGTNYDTYLDSDWIGTDSDGTGITWSSYTGGSGAAAANSSLTVGTPAHLALVRESSTSLIAYLNGTQIGSAVTTNVSSRQAAQMEQIGTMYSYPCPCRLTAIKCWQAALTADEISAEMHSIRPLRLANLHSWHPAIANTLTDALKDCSGNGRDWTSQGTNTVETQSAPVSWGAQPLFINPIIVTAQYVRPTSDVSAGTWTASSGSDLYAMLDETSASDADYIVTTGASTCEVALGSLTDPASSSGHIVRYRISATSGGITVRLRQGTTTVATWVHAPAPTSLTTYAQTLTSGEADSITDYTALRLQFEATT